MSDETLAELLERTAERTEVGAPPMNQMYAAAQRSRRRRGAWTALASAAAVATVIGGLAVLSPGEGGEPPVAEPGLVTPAPGMRLVGVKNVVIEVPEEWGTNETRCSAPRSDTVVIDQGFIPTCRAPWPSVARRVEITQVRRDTTGARTQIQVDGVKASRSETSCFHDTDIGGGMNDVCRSTVEFAEQKVQFQAEVSNPDPDQARAEVDEILSRIHVLPEGQITIPLRESVVLDKRATSGETYVRLLERMGLEPRVEYVDNKEIPDGFAIGVDPAVGTPVTVGDEVTVQVVGDPAKNTPASETADPLEVPEDMRLVGLGPISITVPESWGTNDFSCGSTPTQNTVGIFGGELDCLITHPDDVASVNLRGSDWGDTPGTLKPATVDGVAVQRKDYCKDPANPPSNRVHRVTAQGQPRCKTTIVLPSGTTIEVGSNATGSSPEDTTAALAQVEEIVARIRISHEWVGVPATPATYSGWRADFHKQMEAMDLRAEFIDTPGNKSHPAGSVMLDPEPGTVVRPGSTITVTRYSKQD